MHCHGSWFDSLTIFLGIAVLIAGFVDFLLGHAGRARLQNMLLILWTRFDDIRIPTLGLAEARYCLMLFDKYLSSRLLSVRRFVASLLLCLVFISIYYIAIEMYRHALGMTFRFPFVQPHYATYPILGVISGALSLSVSRIILQWSIRSYGHRKMATLYFGLTVLLYFEITQMVFDLTLPTLSFAITIYNAVVGIIRMTIQGLIRFHTLPSMSFNADGKSFGVGEYMMFAFNGAINNELDNLKQYIAAGIVRIPKVRVLEELIEKGANGEDLSGFYVEWMKLMFSYLRVCFAATFLFLWGVVRPVHRTIELIFRRVLEAEKGPLAAVAVFFAAVVKLVELAVRC